MRLMSWHGPKLAGPWELLVILVTLVMGVAIPLHCALEGDIKSEWHTLNLLMTLVLVLDVGFRLRYHVFSAQVREDIHRGITHRSRYVLICCDILAAIPFTLLPFGFPIWVPLLRLIKFIRVQAIISSWKRRIALSPGLIRMANFIFWMILTAHWVACGWIALRDLDVEDTREPSHRYVEALYWTITTLTTVGYGDVDLTQGDFEEELSEQQHADRLMRMRIYTMLVMIVGVAGYGFVIGNVASLLANVDVARAQFVEKIERTDAFLRYRSVPADVRERVKSYYQHLWDTHFAGDEEMFNDVIDSLRVEVLLHLNRPLIEKVPFFREAKTTFLRDVVQLLKPCVFLPGDYVFKHGEAGHSMFFLSRGEVEVLTKEGNRLAVLQEGAYFGEIALLTDCTRNASIRALDYCNAYELDREAVLKMTEQYPEFARHLAEEAEKRLGDSTGSEPKPEE